MALRLSKEELEQRVEETDFGTQHPEPGNWSGWPIPTASPACWNCRGFLRSGRPRNKTLRALSQTIRRPVHRPRQIQDDQRRVRPRCRRPGSSNGGGRKWIDNRGTAMSWRELAATSSFCCCWRPPSTAPCGWRSGFATAWLRRPPRPAARRSRTRVSVGVAEWRLHELIHQLLARADAALYAAKAKAAGVRVVAANPGFGRC